MKIYETNDIRNIALIGGAKSGKTTMAEAMVFEGKMISRRGSVDDKNTVSDYKPIELDRQNSVHSSLLYTIYNNKKINIIDVPGFSDFVGDTAAALNVCGTALFMINAQNGVEATTETAWKQTQIANVPTVFAINQLDHSGANFSETITSLKDYFGDKVTIVQYPVNSGEGFNTIIDLILMKQLVYKEEGGEPEIMDIPDSEKDKAEELNLLLIENAAECGEELMEIYFENDTLTIEQVREGIRLGMISRTIFPVMCTAAKHGIGATRIMDFIVNSCPSPNLMAPRETTDGVAYNCNAEDKPALFVYKTSIEQHLGEVSFFKVYGGTITEGVDLINPRTGNKERITQMFLLNGKNRTKVEKVVAGDLAVTIKLKDTKTSDSLMDPKSADSGFAPLTLPTPIFTVAMSAVNSSDDEKIGTILNEMHRTDPTIEIEYSRELKQILIKTQGEFHLNTIKWYLSNIHKIEVNTVAPKIPYRETITKTANADYRHKKQSGGSGQFGEVHLRIMPFVEGYANPTDIPVRGTDVHELPVDSNEISFKLAGRFAFSTAFKAAGPKIMEPINNVEINMPEDMMGAVMTDLQGRRGIIMGMDAAGKNQIIRAKVPAAEMTRYATSLSAITSGRGTFSSVYDSYQQVPTDVQKDLLKAYEESQEDED